MCMVLTVLGVWDIMGNKVDITSKLKELQIEAMRQNTKMTFLRGR